MIANQVVWLARLVLTGSMAFAAFGIQACRSLRPYEKEHLLKPAMDDSRIEGLEPNYAKAAAAQFERMGSGANQGGGGSSCPTCGI